MAKTESSIEEIKNIMDYLGRGSQSGEVKGTHLGQILGYLRQHKKEKMRVTLAKLSLICGMNKRYVRENYLEGLEEFEIIKTEQDGNELSWYWIGEKAFTEKGVKHNATETE